MNAHESTHASNSSRRPVRPFGRRVAGAAVVAVVSGLALAGCSGSGEAALTTTAAVEPSPSVSTPAATPRASSSPTPTPTATTVASGAPKRPAGMNANTAEGARKTALYFIQLYPYVMRTGDTKEWDRLSVAKKCDFCAGNRADAIEAHKKHWTRVGGDVSAKVVRTYDRDTLYDGYPVDVRVEQEAFTLKDGTKVVNSKPASTGILSVEVIRSGSRWKIVGVSAAGDS